MRLRHQLFFDSGVIRSEGNTQALSRFQPPSCAKPLSRSSSSPSEKRRVTATWGQLTATYVDTKFTRAHPGDYGELRYQPLLQAENGKIGLHLLHCHSAANRLRRFSWREKEQGRVALDMALGRSHIENLLQIPPPR